MVAAAGKHWWPGQQLTAGAGQAHCCRSCLACMYTMSRGPLQAAALLATQAEASQLTHQRGRSRNRRLHAREGQGGSSLGEGERYGGGGGRALTFKSVARYLDGRHAAAACCSTLLVRRAARAANADSPAAGGLVRGAPPHGCVCCGAASATWPAIAAIAPIRGRSSPQQGPIMPLGVGVMAGPAASAPINGASVTAADPRPLTAPAAADSLRA